MKDGASIYITADGDPFRDTFTPYIASVNTPTLAIHFQGMDDSERLDAIHRLMDGLTELEAKVNAAVDEAAA